jgi:16S rRNA processing protein RimM
MPPPVDGSRPVCLAVIAGAHGVRGLVKVRSFTATPEDVAAYGPLFDEDGRRFVLRLRGRAGDALLAAIDGVADRDAAEALRGRRLLVDRAALPAPAAEEFYHVDLIGLAVEDTAGRAIGRVREVVNYGAGDILEVAPADGGPTRLVPFSRDAVPQVDIAGGRLAIDRAAADWPEDD